MDTSSPNTLNRSMQSLWSVHRKSRLNLNSVPSTPTGEQTPPTDDFLTVAPAEAERSDPLTPAVPASLAEASTSTTTPAAAAEPRSVKRKTRPRTTAADGSDGGKRARLSGSGTIAKDHTPPATRLADLGGVSDAVEKMLELVAMPLCHPEVYLHTGVHPPRGVLLHGPPGCGKTLLANAIAGELAVPFISISAPSIVSGMSGESEKTLRDTFEEAKRVAPCLLFIDEIDAITPKRESAQREMERRIVAQFLTCMDELSWEKTDNKPVIVIGATNRPDSLDAALRRAGRFDHEISMGVPDENARAQILRVMCAKLRLEGDFDFGTLARATAGYVGADLAALTGAAGIIAVKRIFKQLSEGTLVLPGVDDLPDTDGDALMAVDPPGDATTLFAGLQLPLSSPASSIAHFLAAHPSPLTPAQLAPLHLTWPDFSAALLAVQPSSRREGFATVPDVTWADVGALHATRAELHMAVVQPVRRPELFAALGIDAPCGVLLWGPPGCGKTLLAKACANESGASFVSVKGPELLNKYVGESERAVRQVFARARASPPCVIFFDELDALVPRRDDSLSESSARVVNTLLTELDGLDARRGVHVIGATNRPDMIDPAMCRPGRLDKLLYVDLPRPDERAEIMRTMLKKMPLAADAEAGAGQAGQAREDAEEQARAEVAQLVRERGDGYSGADIAALVREAGVAALRRTLDAPAPAPNAIKGTTADTDVRVHVADFRAALEKVRPSVSAAQRRKYEALRTKFAGLPATLRTRKGGDDEPEAANNDNAGEGHQDV